MIRRYTFSMMHSSHFLRLGALMLASAPLFAQLIHIDAGSTADQYYTGGTACSAGTACMPNTAVVPPTLRYGASFRYDIPVPGGGFYWVRLGFIDANKTAAKQRVFTVSINGQPGPPIDLFAQFGNVAGEIDVPVWASWSQVTLVFQATVGNAIVSTIQIEPLWYRTDWRPTSVSDVPR